MPLLWTAIRSRIALGRNRVSGKTNQKYPLSYVECGGFVSIIRVASGQRVLVGRGSVTERLVVAGGAEFYVEVSDTEEEPRAIIDAGPLSFDGARETVEGIATEFAEVWQRVRPSEASVAFGLTLTARSGRLTGLLVQGGGEATLTVRLTWRPPPDAE